MDPTLKRLCTICARGGSKGVKGKNVRLLRGKPLIAHSVERARTSGLFDAVAVSSDSAEIRDLATSAGATLVVDRPAELASDTAAKLPVIQHAVLEVERRLGCRFTTLVDLDVTSPLRLRSDIAGAVALLEETGASNVITGSPARRSPYFNLVELDGSGSVHLSKRLETALVRRQDSPRCFDMNASIYVWQRDALFALPSLFGTSTRLFVMPAERSFDIDSELDFGIVEWLFKARDEKGRTPTADSLGEIDA